MPPAATTQAVFSPGPLGFELEPLWQAGGRAVGCRVAGFKRLPNGRMGQAELMGSTRPGDVLAEVDGVVVSDMSFDKIIALLLHDANRPERHMAFRPGGNVANAKASPAPAPAPAPAPVSLSPKARGPRASSELPAGSNAATITSTGGSTQPATPSPGSQPRPPGERHGFSEDTAAARLGGGGGGEQQQQERRRRRVMGFLGMGSGGRAGGVEVGAAGATFGAGGGSSEDDDDDGEWWRGAQHVGLEEEETPEGGGERRGSSSSDGGTATAAADAVARGSRPSGEEDPHSSQGIAPLFLGGGSPQPTNGFRGTAAAARTSRASDQTGGRGGQAGQDHSFGMAASAVGGGPSLPEGAAGTPDRQAEEVDSIDYNSSATWSTAIHAAVGSGGNDSSAKGRSGGAQQEKSRKVPGSPGSVGVSAPEQHDPPRRANELGPLKAAAAAAVPAVGPGTARVSTGTTSVDGGRPERSRGGGGTYQEGRGEEQQLSRGDSPETVAQSLDTVSLLSEPVAAYSKDAKHRVSMLASLWGGGRGGQMEDVQGEGESEVEGARRLARSLAVKLKERARRCEELEDMFGLRDHQVSQLQRQSNSLAARAASLADDLADKSALVEALQQDRARLEQELAAQSRSQSQSQPEPRPPRGEDGGGRGRGDVSGQHLAVAEPVAVVSAGGEGGGGDGPSLHRLGGGGSNSSSSSSSSAGVVADDNGGKTVAAIEAAAAAGALAATVDAAAERKAGEAVAAAEARCRALAEMVDSLVGEKVGWEEERASSAAESMRLRARVRGLEEAVVDRRGGVGGGDDDGWPGDHSGQALLVEELRKLVRERTRELEVKGVSIERLAANARELEEDKRRLSVSLSAREEDLLVSDRQMQALSARLKGEASASGEAAARAEAVAGELRTALAAALEEATTAEGAAAGEGDRIGGKTGGQSDREREGGGTADDRPPPPPTTSAWDRAAWAEERARLHHNLLSLRQALEDSQTQADADEAAVSSRLKAAQDEGERYARERAFLREALDSLRVDLAEALTAAAAAAAAGAAGAAGAGASAPGRPGDGGVQIGGGGGTPARPAASPSSSAAAAVAAASFGAIAAGEGEEEEEEEEEEVEEEEDPRAEEEGAEGGGSGEVVVRLDGDRVEEGEDAQEGEEMRDPGEKEGGVRGAGNGRGGWPASTAEERKPEAEGAGSGHRRIGSDGGGSGGGGVEAGARDRWLDGGFEGTVDDLQLDLMEKDIVIEQLRNQLKQLRSKLAMMEEEQAADTAPLQGLLNQLGELKGSVEEREGREQQCRDQVDLGLMRMERLKEENAAAAATATAAVTSPPVSFAGSTGASPPFLPQADPSSRGQAQAQQVEQQRLRRQLEDLQWDLRTARRRVDERDHQLRDARADGDRLKRGARDAERELGAAQSELAVAAAEAAAQRRRSGTLRAELQSLRAELQSARDRERAASAAAAAAAMAAKSSAEERQRSRLGAAEGRDYSASAAATEAEIASDRVASVSASLRAVTVERDDLLAAKHASAAAAAASFGLRAEDGAARTREVESMRCALAARDVELESIVDATAGFVHRTDGSLGGGGGVGSSGGDGGASGNALRCALAAASEARRSQCLVAELREEASSLKARVEGEHAEVSRLRAAVERAQLAEKKSASAAAAAAATAAAVVQSSPTPAESNDAGRERGGCSEAEARAVVEKRAQAAEDALQKALAAAQRAWGVVSSCLADGRRPDEEDLFGAIAAATPPPPLPTAVASSLYPWQQQQPAPSSSLSSPPADPSLGALVSGVEALASAYRGRGHALRRATVAARAKTVCSREARRREETEARAREEAEARLEEALVALDHCQRHHHREQQQQQQQQRQQQRQPASWGLIPPGGGWAAGVVTGGDEGERPALSKDQEEHLRQIRSEVDRLEDQNRTLRRSLEGGDAPGPGPGHGYDRLLGKTTEIRAARGSRGREAEITVGFGPPTQRLLFPPSSPGPAGGGKETERAGGRRPSSRRADCWERVEGLGGGSGSRSSSSGQARTPSPSPVRSWGASASGTRARGGGGSPWARRGGGAAGGDGHDGRGRCGGEEDDGDEDEDDDARARVLEECAGYCAPPQEDGSGGTLVPAWGRNG